MAEEGCCRGACVLYGICEGQERVESVSGTDMAGALRDWTQVLPMGRSAEERYVKVKPTSSLPLP